MSHSFDVQVIYPLSLLALISFDVHRLTMICLYVQLFFIYSFWNILSSLDLRIGVLQWVWKIFKYSVIKYWLILSYNCNQLFVGSPHTMLWLLVSLLYFLSLCLILSFYLYSRSLIPVKFNLLFNLSILF